MKELTVNATFESIDVVTSFVNAELDGYDCPVKTQLQIDVAIDELFSNIARYAYTPGTGTATVQVEIEKEPPTAVITFIDQGIAYDPLTNPDPDTTLPAEERQAGGLGIFLVKKTMDDVNYEYRDGQNILRIRKRL